MDCKMIRKMLSVLLAAVMCFSGLVIPAAAEGRISSVQDLCDMIPLVEESPLRDYLAHAANEIDCNIAVYYVDELYGEDITEYAKRQMESLFGAGENAAILIVCCDSAGDQVLVEFQGDDAEERFAAEEWPLMHDAIKYVITCDYLNAGYTFADNLCGIASVSVDSGKPQNKEYRGVISEESDSISDSEYVELTQLLTITANKIKCNIGIIFQDDLGGEVPGRIADEFLDREFGKDSDSIVMLLTTDPDGHDWISFSNAADVKYSAKADDIFNNTYDGMTHGYANAIRGFCSYFGIKSEYKSEETEGFSVKLADLDDSLSAAEEQAILSQMEIAAKQIECNVGIVITDDLGGKNSEKYADSFADESFGYGSDNVVLLMCNDHIHEDWISAYGRGTDLYGRRIDDLFDRLYNGYDRSGFAEGLEEYLGALVYYGSGVGDDYYYDYDDDYEYEYNSDSDPFGRFVFSWIAPLVVALVISLTAVSGVTSGYKRKKPVSARVYMDTRRTRFLSRQDNFVREYTSSHKISSSSGGGGGRRGGGGGRSRSGRSGGGGRRR